jgi:hypothetical protein
MTKIGHFVIQRNKEVKALFAAMEELGLKRGII